MSDVVTMVYDPDHTVSEMKVWLDRPLLMKWTASDQDRLRYYYSAKEGDRLREKRSAANRFESAFKEKFGHTGFNVVDSRQLKLRRNPAIVESWREYLEGLCQILHTLHGVDFNVMSALNDNPSLYLEDFDGEDFVISIDKE